MAAYPAGRKLRSIPISTFGDFASDPFESYDYRPLRVKRPAWYVRRDYLKNAPQREVVFRDRGQRNTVLSAEPGFLSRPGENSSTLAG